MARFTTEGHLNRRQGSDGSAIANISVVNSDSTNNVLVLAAPGANLRYVITDIIATNEDLTAIVLEIRSGGTTGSTGGTVKVKQLLAASGGGFVMPFSKGIPMGTNEILHAAVGSAIAAGKTLYLTINAYIESVGN